MKIGFIGVGTMGRHMAANLIKSGFSLVVNDVRKEATNPHVKDGATWDDVADAFEVTRQAAHERFRTGPDGLHSRYFKRQAG